MNKFIKRPWSLQSQLIAVFLLTFSILFFINVYMYSSMRTMIENVEQIYVGNKNLMIISGKLDEVHSCVTDYLDTQSTDSLTRFYDCEKEYKKLTEGLNDQIIGQDSLIMEKNIRNMSESYLSVANKAINAKRGRKIEEYQKHYEEATQLFDYLNTCIQSLNNVLFTNNSRIYDGLLASTRVTEIVHFLILLLAGAFNVGLVIILTKTLTKPLIQLARTAEEVGKGNLEVQLIDTTNRTEIGIVMRAFNQMIHNLKEYILKLKKSMEAESALREKEIQMKTYLRDAQLKYLRAQIDPHFLYNTLNAGAQLAMMEDANRTYQYIHNVADFFRYTIKKTDRLTSLKEEIELIDNYIYILNVRYSGEIHYEKLVDESLLNISVPSMILQPIVENCIKHGFDEIEWEKKIVLSAAKEGNFVVLSIRDNGVGMSGEQISRIINSKLQEENLTGESRGIGLDSVIARLQTFYGREDVIEIASMGKNMGTEVAVFIPFEDKESENV